MNRVNLTNEGIAKEFNNGNINIKLNRDTLAEIATGRTSDIENISWLLESIDTYFIGEEFCLSNCDMGAELYNCRIDRVYIISFTDIENVLKSGKTLKLYASIPTDTDRETLSEEGY